MASVLTNHTPLLFFHSIIEAEFKWFFGDFSTHSFDFNIVFKSSQSATTKILALTNQDSPDDTKWFWWWPVCNQTRGGKAGPQLPSKGKHTSLEINEGTDRCYAEVPRLEASGGLVPPSLLIPGVREGERKWEWEAWGWGAGPKGTRDQNSRGS